MGGGGRVHSRGALVWSGLGNWLRSLRISDQNGGSGRFRRDVKGDQHAPAHFATRPPNFKPRRKPQSEGPVEGGQGGGGNIDLRKTGKKTKNFSRERPHEYYRKTASPLRTEVKTRRTKTLLKEIVGLWEKSRS